MSFLILCSLGIAGLWLGDKLHEWTLPKLPDGRRIVEDDYVAPFKLGGPVVYTSRAFKAWNISRCWCGVEAETTRLIDGQVIDFCERHGW